MQPAAALASRVFLGTAGPISLAMRVAKECETIGYRVTDAPEGGPALYNLWAKVGDADEIIMVGWVMRSGLTHLIDPVWVINPVLAPAR